MNLRRTVLALVLASTASTGCTTVMFKQGYAPLAEIETSGTVSLDASSAKGGGYVADDPSLLAQLTASVRRHLPEASVVMEAGDLHVILVVVDYVPGCAPNCRKFPTYRNWSCTVLVPRAQVFGVEGETYNPFFSVSEHCLSRFAARLANLRGLREPQ